MLAKLALTPRESRDFSAFMPEIPLTNLQALNENELDMLFTSYDENKWVELIAICDQNANTSLEGLFKAAKKLAKNDQANETARINAYIFLRSQNQNISSPITLLNFAEFIYLSDNLEALSVLLLDSHFPDNGLASIRNEATKKRLAIHFPKLIEWAQSNTDAATTKKLMQHFVLMGSQLVLIQLIDYAQNGVCTWEELHDLLSLHPPIIADDLFSIFFLKQMLDELPASGEISIAEVLKYYNTLPDLKNSEIANKVFTVFIAPALKAHPKYLLSTGKNILSLHPHLLEMFAPLVASMTFDAETIQFLADATIKFTNDWKLLTRDAENLPASDFVRILENIERDFDTQYSEQVENFMEEAEEEYVNYLEAKNYFIEDVLMPEQAAPIFDALDRNSRHSAHQTLHHFLKVPGVSEKILENNAEQFAHDLQKIMPEVEKIAPKLAIWILSQMDVSNTPSLFSALTAVDDYAGVEKDITQFINHPDFHIEHYYANASQAFKQLPDVTIAMQLYCFSNKNIGNVLTEESHHYTTALHQSLALTPTAYQDSRLLGSLLAYRITEDERVNNSGDTMRAVRKSITTFIKQHLVNGKDAKIPFLRYILTHLMQYGEFSSNNTAYPDAPFIWSLYAEAYLPIKAAMKGEILSEENKRYSPEKITKINSWLKEQILEASNAPETTALLSLSEALRQAIFSFKGSEIDAITLKPVKRSSMIVNASSLWSTPDASSENSKSTSTTPEHN